MAARRRAGSFSAKTSCRLRVSKVAMLEAMARLLSASCQRLRSTASFVLQERPARSSMSSCGSSEMRRAMSAFYNGATRQGISGVNVPGVLLTGGFKSLDAGHVG